MDRKIVFVSGKGGVGKSLTAAAIAQALSQAGRKVLLAEVGETSYYKDFWGLPAVGHDPIRINAGFDLALWSGESCLREYVLYYLRMQSLYKLFFENRVMRALINVAPGLAEIAILGKITSGERKVGPPLVYDHIVVDCYATGHAMALFHAPQGMMEAIRFGPMEHQSREIEKVIQDQKRCSYVVVTLLEELPVVEGLEFAQSLHRELGVTCEMVANKVMEPPLIEDELRRTAANGNDGVVDFARHLLAVLERQKKFRATLEASAAHLKFIPLIFSTDATQMVNEAQLALLGTSEVLSKPR